MNSHIKSNEKRILSEQYLLKRIDSLGRSNFQEGQYQ